MLVTLAIALTACGEDPVLQAAREEAEQGSSVQAPPPGGQPPPGQEGGQAKGVPEDPPPGNPDQPPPPGGAPGGGDGTIPPPPGVDTVTLTGTVEVEDYVRGAITIDVFDGDNSQQGGKRPDIVGRIKLDAPGPFEMQVEQGKTVWLSAYADQDENNRPSKEDPIGECSCNPLHAGKDASGLVLTLTRGHAPKD